jgi:hypothetical protein
VPLRDTARGSIVRRLALAPAMPLALSRAKMEELTQQFLRLTPIARDSN